MLGMMDEFRDIFEDKGIDVHCPAVVQALSEDELKKIVPQHDGWIIGDDPATREVLEAGAVGRLKAAVKWGIGVDNVDFAAARELKILVSNTPNMFGREVADVAMAYVTALARELFFIDRRVRGNHWPKPRGISLKGKTVGLVGVGDIGRSFAERAVVAGMELIAYDPGVRDRGVLADACWAEWPDRVELCDFLVFTCALTDTSRHMLNEATLSQARDGVRIVNVARGPLIYEQALAAALGSGKVHSAALDVFEEEPLPADSPLRSFDNCVFGSHNGSNTIDGVRRASHRAIGLLFSFLGIESSVNG
jgi:D-3-phosphoglycerate dehydrogenase